jgi:hypothetical protein
LPPISAKQSSLESAAPSTSGDAAAFLASLPPELKHQISTLQASLLEGGIQPAIDNASRLFRLQAEPAPHPSRLLHIRRRPCLSDALEGCTVANVDALRTLAQVLQLDAGVIERLGQHAALLTALAEAAVQAAPAQAAVVGGGGPGAAPVAAPAPSSVDGVSPAAAGAEPSAVILSPAPLPSDAAANTLAGGAHSAHAFRAAGRPLFECVRGQPALRQLFNAAVRGADRLRGTAYGVVLAGDRAFLAGLFGEPLPQAADQTQRPQQAAGAAASARAGSDPTAHSSPEARGAPDSAAAAAAAAGSAASAALATAAGRHAAGCLAGGHALPVVLDADLRTSPLPGMVAARAGDVAALQALHAAGWRLSEATCAAAGEGGHTPALQWLRSLEPPCPWNAHTATEAAAGGHLDTLRWALQDGGCPAAPELCLWAVDGGHADVLRWLVEEWRGHAWDETVDAACCALAAGRGDLATLQYLRAHGCPWDGQTLGAADGEEHADVAAWARVHGCPEPDTASSDGEEGDEDEEEEEEDGAEGSYCDGEEDEGEAAEEEVAGGCSAGVVKGRTGSHPSASSSTSEASTHMTPAAAATAAPSPAGAAQPQPAHGTDVV